MSANLATTIDENHFAATDDQQQQKDLSGDEKTPLLLNAACRFTSSPIARSIDDDESTPTVAAAANDVRLLSPALKRSSSSPPQAAPMSAVDSDSADEIVQVTCGSLVGKMHMSRFVCPGIHQACIECQGQFMTPKAFTVAAAKDKQKDWKGAIKLNRQPLRVLFERQLIDFYRHSEFCSGRCVSKNNRAWGSLSLSPAESSSDATASAPSPSSASQSGADICERAAASSTRTAITPPMKAPAPELDLAASGFFQQLLPQIACTSAATFAPQPNALLSAFANQHQELLHALGLRNPGQNDEIIDSTSGVGQFPGVPAFLGAAFANQHQELFQALALRTTPSQLRFDEPTSLSGPKEEHVEQSHEGANFAATIAALASMQSPDRVFALANAELAAATNLGDILMAKHSSENSSTSSSISSPSPLTAPDALVFKEPLHYWNCVEQVGLFAELIADILSEVRSIEATFMTQPDLRPEAAKKLSELVRVLDLKERIDQRLLTKRCLARAQTAMLSSEIEDLRRKTVQQRRKQSEMKRKSEIFDQLVCCTNGTAGNGLAPNGASREAFAMPPEAKKNRSLSLGQLFPPPSAPSYVKNGVANGVDRSHFPSPL